MADNLYSNKNIIVSPMSLNMALGMVANAAGPKPLSDLESYLGKSVGNYNQFALNMMNRAESDKMLSLANGVWYKTGCNINPLFANNIKKYYKGEMKEAPLNNTTKEEINQWASDKTDGMIPKIIDDIPANTSSILLNALLFQGKWTSPFEHADVENGKFETVTGKKVNAKMMNGRVNTYFENEKAVGFEKTYGKNREYSFIAILPKEKGDFNLKDLDIQNFLNTKTNDYNVNIQIPKFSYSWRSSLKAVLSKTEIKSIFDEYSNPISKLFTGYGLNTWVDDVIQSCKVEMDEDGTKAAAVTAVIVKCTSVPIEIKKIKTVNLNRSFAYIITDNATNEVMFMGKVIDTSKK